MGKENNVQVSIRDALRFDTDESCKFAMFVMVVGQKCCEIKCARKGSHIKKEKHPVAR